MNKKRENRFLTYILCVLQLFIGITAILGGLALVSDPTGAKYQLSLDWLINSPFQDYFIPGLVLLVVNGAGFVLAAAATFLRHRYTSGIGVALAVFLILYLTVEVWIIGLRNSLQPLYFLLGGIVLALALKLSRKGNRLLIESAKEALPI